MPVVIIYICLSPLWVRFKRQEKHDVQNHVTYLNSDIVIRVDTKTGRGRLLKGPEGPVEVTELPP